MDNRTIYLETKPVVTTNSYDGNITIENRSFDFHISCTTQEDLEDFIEIFWINDIIPNNSIEIEKEIIQEFKKGR